MLCDAMLWRITLSVGFTTKNAVYCIHKMPRSRQRKNVISVDTLIIYSISDSHIPKLRRAQLGIFFLHMSARGVKHITRILN